MTKFTHNKLKSKIMACAGAMLLFASSNPAMAGSRIDPIFTNYVNGQIDPNARHNPALDLQCKLAFGEVVGMMSKHLRDIREKYADARPHLVTYSSDPVAAAAYVQSHLPAGFHQLSSWRQQHILSKLRAQAHQATRKLLKIKLFPRTTDSLAVPLCRFNERNKNR